MVALPAFLVLAALELASLPLTTFSTLPSIDDVPPALNNGEKVGGVFAALPPQRHRGNYDPPGQRYVSLFTRQSDADDFADGKGRPLRRMLAELKSKVLRDTPVDGPPCFSVVETWHLRHHREGGWPLAFRATPSLHGFVRGTPAEQRYKDDGVRRVRLETLKRSDDKVTLEVQHFWFDPSNLSSRHIETSAVPLSLVAEGPGEIEVYAARSEAGDVQFVVRTPTHPGSPHIGRGTQLVRGNDSGHSDCGHATLRLGALVGFGETASAQMEVMLPSDDVDKPKSDEAKPDGDKPQRREVRMRPLRVQLGLSQSSSDPKPLPTVSFAWAGRERRQQIF